MTNDESQIKKDKIMSIALWEATKYSIAASAIVGAATVAATYRNKNFARFMSLSAKVSLPVMAGMGMFSYRFEIVQHQAMMNPEKWGLPEYGEEEKVITSNMPMHHRAINYLYDHPFYFVAGIGFPFAGLILNEQLKLKHLTVSQKVMHSRIYAQGGVLLILLSTMAFREYMDRHGRFPEPQALVTDELNKKL